MLTWATTLKRTRVCVCVWKGQSKAHFLLLAISQGIPLGHHLLISLNVIDLKNFNEVNLLKAM